MPLRFKVKRLTRARRLLVEDNHLTSRNDTDDFKQKHGVETTPQTFIEEKRIGGYDELRKYFGKGEAGQNGTTYAPVIAIFSVAALLSLAFQFFVSEDFISIRTLFSLLLSQ